MDGVGEILSIAPVGRYVEIWIKAPVQLAKYLAEKARARWMV